MFVLLCLQKGGVTRQVPVFLQRINDTICIKSNLYWSCIQIHIFIWSFCALVFPFVFVLLCLKKSVSCRKVALALQRSPTHLIMIHVCRNCIYILLAFVLVFQLYLNTHFHLFSFVFILLCLKRSVYCRKVALALQRILSPFDTLWHTLTHLHFDET